MRNYYLKANLIMALLFVVQLGYSQNALNESPNGAKIQSFLVKEKADYNLIENDVQDLFVTNEFYSKASEITNVYVNQRYQGIKIHNAISSFAMREGVVFYYANSFVSNIQSKINTITPSISAETAIYRAASHFNLGSVQGLEMISSNNGKDFVFTNGSVSKKEIPVSIAYQVMEDGNLKLSWDLSIQTNDGQNWWSARVDAVSGEVLNSNNWILSCNFGDGKHANHKTHKVESTDFNLFKTNSLMVDGSSYNVVAIPNENPLDGGRTLISEPANVVASPFGWHDTNGTAGADFTNTRGNNVWAQEDVDGNDGFGSSPDGTTSLTFDFPLNLSQAPLGYQNASTTNLFYMNNIMHDVWYVYGFDEASGNFQQNNYGNGGAGTDFVFADAQDGSFLNNSTFSSPPDGQNGVMTMFLWSEPFFKQLVTINGGTLAGAYTAVNPATGVGNNIPGATTTAVTADLVLVDDASAAPTEACSPVVNDLTGKIAVIKRGNCNFTVKIQNAQDAGAIGVIMVNHNNPTNDPAYVEYVTMSGETSPQLTIPSVFMNHASGQLIIDAIENGETINATLQDYQTFQIDGDLDNSIVAHEYAHGISIRLTGGAANSGCLSNEEQQGEGWSDWFALMLTMKDGDIAAEGRGIATYAFGQDINGLGIRTKKYSTDFSINDFTYGDTNDTNLLAPHGLGSVWGTMLWDLTWAYIDKYGFDEDFYNGNGGNNKVMQLVIDGLKLQPCGTGFVDSRDALLAADTALTGGEDQCLIWEVFVARGLGINASQGTSFSRIDQVEDFTMLPDTDQSLANCNSLSVEEFDEKDYQIYPNPTNNKLFIKTNKNFGEVMITLTDINGRLVHSQKANLFNTVELNINKLQSGLYMMNINGETINTNDKIIKN